MDLQALLDEHRKAGNAPKASQINTFVDGLGPKLVELTKTLASVASDFAKAKTAGCELNDQLSKDVRINADDTDDVRQQLLLGRMIITVSSEQLKNEIGIADHKDYADIKVDRLTAAISSRYKIDLSPEHLTEVRRISRKGNIMIKFAKTTFNSPFFNLVQAIKKPGSNSKDHPLFANFALTQRRSELLYLMRLAWKEQKN